LPRAIARVDAALLEKLEVSAGLHAVALLVEADLQVAVLDGVDDYLAEAAREEAGLVPPRVGREIGRRAPADPVRGREARIDVEALPRLHEGVGEGVLLLGDDAQEYLPAVERVDPL